VLAAMTRNSVIDLASMVVALVGVAAPNFWIGLILLSGVAANVSWVPVFGRGPGFLAAIGTFVTSLDVKPLFD